MFSFKDNKAFFAVLFFLLFICVLGMIISILFKDRLFKTPQDLESYISETTAAADTFRLQPPKSEHEQLMNPFGEAWINKTAPNPDIPVSLDYCFNVIYGNNLLREAISEEEVVFISKHNNIMTISMCPMIELYFGYEAYDVVGKYRDIANRVKAKNPQIKILTYTTFNRMSPLFSFYPRMTEEMFVHKKGTPILKANRIPHMLEPLFGGGMAVSRCNQ